MDVMMGYAINYRYDHFRLPILKAIAIACCNSPHRKKLLLARAMVIIIICDSKLTFGTNGMSVGRCNNSLKHSLSVNGIDIAEECK